jgi:long-chain acyl-CoA synthetase
LLGRLPIQRSGVDLRSALPETAERQLRASPYICDAIVLDEAHGPTHGLPVLEEDAIRRYAQDHDLPLADFSSLVQHPRIEALPRGEIEQANRCFTPPLQLTGTHILPFVLAFGMDEWTPALRLNRRVFLQQYAPYPPRRRAARRCLLSPLGYFIIA